MQETLRLGMAGIVLPLLDYLDGKRSWPPMEFQRRGNLQLYLNTDPLPRWRMLRDEDPDDWDWEDLYEEEDWLEHDTEIHP